MAQGPFIDVGSTLEWEILFYALFAAAIIVKPLERQLTIILVLLLGIAVALDRFFALEFVLGMTIAYLVVHR